MYFVCDENKYIDCFNSFGDIDKAKEGRNKWKLQVAIWARNLKFQNIAVEFIIPIWIIFTYGQ